MKRILGVVLMSGLLLVGSACGSSGGGSSANSDVEAYCKAVDTYIQKVKEATSDPAGAQSLAKEGQDLSTKAAALASAGLSADDANAVGDCTKRSTDALTPAG